MTKRFIMYSIRLFQRQMVKWLKYVDCLSVIILRLKTASTMLSANKRHLVINVNAALQYTFN